jgi:hypothetical protein
MTRKQAIRKLADLGFVFLRNDGRFCAYFRTPAGFERDFPQGREILADPKDLLEEVQLKAAVKV